MSMQVIPLVLAVPTQKRDFGVSRRKKIFWLSVSQVG
jgi:hypothetical protein